MADHLDAPLIVCLAVKFGRQLRLGGRSPLSRLLRDDMGCLAVLSRERGLQAR
jgi:hypothetical protein